MSEMFWNIDTIAHNNFCKYLQIVCIVVWVRKCVCLCAFSTEGESAPYAHLQRHILKMECPFNFSNTQMAFYKKILAKEFECALIF